MALIMGNDPRSSLIGSLSQVPDQVSSRSTSPFSENGGGLLAFFCVEMMDNIIAHVHRFKKINVKKKSSAFISLYFLRFYSNMETS